MALSNRERIDRMFVAMAPVLDDFIASIVGQGNPSLGAEWTKLVQGKDVKNGVPATKTYEPLDPQVQFRMLTEANITGGYRKGWYPFDEALGKAGKSYAIELREVRNTWAHHGSTFSDDDAYRALDTGERLLKLVGAASVADEVRSIRLNLRRVTAHKDDKKVLKAAVDNPESSGLKPWREVLPPHDDVATGNFAASEFAADLYKVAFGGEQDADYADPVEFFKRTYLTEGLIDLIGRAVRRLSGDDNAPPVINLQTNFGGGKTHSMLALWHIGCGLPVGKFPQETQDLLTANGYTGTKVNRVAIVGNHLSPSGVVKDDGTRVNTIWGELAWQLGGAEAFALVAKADADRTHPGPALHELLAKYSPAVILIDEWVAYARSLVGRDDLAGGTFDDQFTFAQSLTEAAKGTSGVLLVISIPASSTGDDGDKIVAGNAEEVGGANGLEALKRLQNVVRRVADQWRPASSSEAYQIVRQRLFKQPDAAALAAIGATARAYVEMYRKYSDDFPRDSRDPAYEDRIKRTYPIHPELFDRLYEEWSSLERFQRTRGVLRLMSTVIHALWTGEDASPLIMPGSIPLATANVNSELTQYLQDSWKAIIDADVDGPNSEPARIDAAKPLFGQRSLTKRLARTVFFGAVPTIGSAHKGLETQRVFLGTAVPGDVPGNFHSALTQLGDRATYFYSGSGKYWYDLQANITRTAKDQAERLHKEDVWAEIVRRLLGQAKTRGDFAGVHVCPESNADIPDTDEARLVILHPKVAHKRGADSAAKEFAKQATEHRGTANRTNRNMLAYLAADEARLDELDSAVREYLGWTHVLGNEADLDLTQNQKNQATQRQTQADGTVNSRLLQTFTWALVPTQPDPGAPFVIRETKVEGQSPALAERVSRRLGSDGDLSIRQAAATIRLAIGKVPQIWKDGHVSLGALWRLYSQYPYMPRLRDRRVLDEGIVDMPMIWHADAFALATGFDEAAGRYIGLWTPDDKGAAPAATDSLLLVRPDVAVEQRETEVTPPGPDDEATPAEDDDKTPKPPVDIAFPPQKTRFYGVKTLSADKIALDFKNVAEEIIAHLRDTGTKLIVKIEIEATDATGFDEGKIRTVSENAQTLKFDQSGFEES
ncbi:Swt1 family HEPN domain-containing protein [Mycolicibacterium elephantis]|uniref:ATPase AAA n=1 Tax=Mycolicibacterium elephantis DSM 44368 TaxID=1335622 RepID=A0A439DQR9_9MYCO|nr:Swt1 family HEPN domain-containing protein [Mycolicibacterium elephantis]MCV7221016.1 ATP-binding protein [Mycolicibacterium elephantis]RWA18094.1 ATPase AAA [Mycolicibacterium elephantis DSM 44368]